MKFHLSSTGGNTISACFADAVVVNQHRHTHSIIVCADKPVAAWAVRGVADITPAALQPLAELATAGMLILLGIGEKPPLLNPQWQAPFIERQGVIEVMSLRAACRTYNILQGDGRLVMAALVLGGDIEA